MSDITARRPLTDEQRRALASGRQPIYWPGNTPPQSVSQAPPKSSAIRPALTASQLLDYHACWAALHSLVEWSPETTSAWLATVPAINCGCQQFARDYVATNPPPYGDMDGCRRWSWEFHSAVDRKTGDTTMSWADACDRWGW